MSQFLERFNAPCPSDAARQWLYVPYDQLTDQVGLLASLPASEVGIILVESAQKARRRPYHKQKLLWILASQRHFAVEQQARGVRVRYLMGDQDYATLLRPHLAELGGAVVMAPAERELRVELQPLVDAGLLRVVPHEGWLTQRAWFDALGAPPWRMDKFYRTVRQKTNVMMQGGKPEGGRYSFDGENRKRWRGDPPAPEPPRFEPSDIVREVGALIEGQFGEHPGRLDLTTVAASREQVEHMWQWAKSACLPTFGPYEDAMSTQSRGLFHTRLSPLIHLHRLMPARVLRETLALDLPLPSKEGFVRQLIGWREFIKHVHDATDGLRSLTPERSEGLGDGGWSRWRGRAWNGSAVPEAGAAPSYLGAETPLPAAFWGTKSGLHCLDAVIEDVWDEGYSHHITRLMVLSNLATLLDISPRELTDWFWVAYIDAFDWVVEPNVLGMGTYAVGPVMTTKPYVSGSSYLHKMGDYCKTCAFDPKKDCPIKTMYWSFLSRHEDRFQGNIRMAMPMRSLKKRAEAAKWADARIFEGVQRRLAAGEAVTPADVKRWDAEARRDHDATVLETS